MMRLISVLLALVLLTSWNGDSVKYPTDYFDLPLNRSILLSGTFGELRPGHFHSGIDIKSLERKSGEDVLASASGYIQRIKVAPGGYGNAIYIAHPNGYTTVYAHLDRFTDNIAAYVKRKQYQKKQFSVDLYLNPDQFRIEQNQLIGYLGNSGSSSAPHLHFEIRKSLNQVPINPLLFGLQITDNVRPNLGKLRVYYLNEQLEPIHTKEYTLQNKSTGNYTIADTLTEGAWRVGIAIKATDKMDGAPNRNGIYTLDMRVDDLPQFSFEMDEVPFSKTRYLNAHIDYAAKQSNKGYFHRCYKLPGNALDIYDSTTEQGVVKLFANKVQEVKIEVQDFNKNTSTLRFFIKRNQIMYDFPSRPAEFFADNLGSVLIDKPGFKCNIIKGALYGQTGISYQTETQAKYPFAAVHQIGSGEIPLHKYVPISIKSADILTDKLSKLFIARIDDEKIINYGGKPDGEFITTSVRELGTYTIGIDTVAPTIQIVQFSSQMQGAARMRFKITDNTLTRGRARGLRYQAHVDGEWILMEYDAKRNLLTHWFDDRIDPGKHEFVLIVTDDRGNQGRIERTFER